MQDCKYVSLNIKYLVPTSMMSEKFKNLSFLFLISFSFLFFLKKEEPLAVSLLLSPAIIFLKKRKIFGKNSSAWIKS